MENKEIMRKGQILEDGVSSEFWQEMSRFIDQEKKRVTAGIVNGDFDDLKELYFLKGQLIGLAKTSSYPTIIIDHRKKLLEEEAEKRKKEK